MTKLFYSLLTFFFLPLLWGGLGWGQNIGINTTGAAGDASAILDVSAPDKGLLIPRVSLTSTTDVTTITSPATSLMVYNTNATMTNGNGTGYYYWNGTKWISVGTMSVSGNCFCGDWTLVGVANGIDGSTGIYSSGYTIQTGKEYVIIAGTNTTEITVSTSDAVLFIESDVVVGGSVANHNYRISTPISFTVVNSSCHINGTLLNGNAADFVEWNDTGGIAFIRIYGNGLVQLRDAGGGAMILRFIFLKDKFPSS